MLRNKVSLAIINSSFVGTTYTSTAESGVLIFLNSPNTLFASGSILMPRQARFSQTLALVGILFSPTPAVKQMTSAPPNRT